MGKKIIPKRPKEPTELPQTCLKGKNYLSNVLSAESTKYRFTASIFNYNLGTYAQLLQRKTRLEISGKMI